METKVCNGCLERKSVNEFHFRSQSQNTRAPRCKACKKNQDANIWSAGTKKVTSLENMLERKRKSRDYVWSILVKSECADCGNADPLVMEFDHLGNKVYNVSSMMQKGYAVSALAKEIAKCEVVCANCHRKRTYAREGSWRTLK